MGEGPQFVPEHDDAKVVERMQAWWERFTVFNDWDTLEDEIPGRLWRDGEFFLRFTEHEAEGPLSSELDTKVKLALAQLRGRGVTVPDLEGPDVPAGMMFLRLIPPDQIADPTNQISHGIITTKDDVQTVLGYCWTPSDTVREVIAASEMLHRKIRVDSDVKRGRSILEPILKRTQQYEQWLNYRLILNLMRTAVVLVKKVEGTAGQVQAVRDAQEKDRDDTNTRKLKRFKPGTTIHAGPGIEYEFKHPKIDASDAKDDGRALLLTMAAASGLPEYMFTGDASNANFASTMVAESPAVREFQDWQDFLTPDYRHIYRRVMIAATKQNQIEGLTPEEAEKMYVDVQWPPMMSRDEKDQAEADELRLKNRVLSLEGFARRQGIDWEVERDRILNELKDRVGTAPDRSGRQGLGCGRPRRSRHARCGGGSGDPAVLRWAASSG
jgi:hypothetical protein